MSNVRWIIPKDATLTVDETIEVAEYATAAFIRIYEQETWGTPPVVQSGGALVVFNALRRMLDGSGRLGDGWTFIVEDDPTTLPPFSADERLVACHRKGDDRIRRVIPLLYNQSVVGCGYWHYNVESHGKIGIEHWVPDAWREWPEAPPRLLLTDEG